jgi:hypothetical protein
MLVQRVQLREATRKAARDSDSGFSPLVRTWRNPFMVFRISAIMLSLVVVTGSQQLRSQSKANPGGFDLVDKTGNIRKPLDYRDHYPAL